MDWTMIGALGEIVGAIAVVASLLYLAKQVRFAATQAQVQNRRSAIDWIMSGSNRVSVSGDMAEIFARGAGSFRDLPEVDRIRFSALLGPVFAGFEEACQAQAAGNWPDWSGSDMTKSLSEILSLPGVQEWVVARKHTFTREFWTQIEGVVEEKGAVLPPWTGKAHGADSSGNGQSIEGG